MSYELLTTEDYENLPDDPGLKFVELESLCRKSVNELLKEDSSAQFDNMLRLQYMTTVSAAAQELGFDGLEFPYDSERPEYEFSGFLMKASGVVTRIRLRSGVSTKALSVRLSARTRGKIELQIEKLRGVINAADMPEHKRSSLLKKLDDLSFELGEPRLSFGKAMKILAFIGMGVATSTSFLADAPGAIATITSLIGQDKAAEESEIARLGAPPKPKLLPPPAPATAPRPDTAWDDLDDDVPF